MRCMLEEARVALDGLDIWAWLESTGQFAWAMLRLERAVFGWRYWR